MIVVLQGVQAGLAAYAVVWLIHCTLAGYWLVPEPKYVLTGVVIGIAYMALWGLYTGIRQGLASRE
jgi:hypothetical protein